MRIAYLIQAHNNPLQLNRLIKALDNSSVDFFIHIDKKTFFQFRISHKKNVHILSDPVSVFWGGFSQVEASLRLLAEAKQTGTFDYFVLLSGVDYPIRSNAYIMNFFHQFNGTEFIDIYKMPLFDKSFDRVDYFCFEYTGNKILDLIIMKVNKAIRLLHLTRSLPKKYKNITLYAGASWWALTEPCVDYLLTFIKNNPRFTSFYKHTLCPDEMFFQTIMKTAPKPFTVMNSITYTDWSGNEKPAKIAKGHFTDLAKEFIPTSFGNKKKYLLFARKLTDESGEIVKKIDEELRHTI